MFPQGAPLVLSMGDPAGIGAELVLDLWQRRHEWALPPFVVLHDPDYLSQLARTLDLAVPLAVTEDVTTAAAAFGDVLPIVPVPLNAACTPGQPDPAHAAATVQALALGCDLVESGAAAGLVTLPVTKSVLYEAGFPHSGHTEFLRHRFGNVAVAMMLVAQPRGVPPLRAVPITIHTALRDVTALLDEDLIVRTARVVHRGLQQRFGMARPRLVLAGLNPHAGEGGALGDEEARIIKPALDTLRAEGMAVDGPRAADTLFHEDARRTYDAALCMYHDQALIPVKTLDFHGGVNVTLGLPIVRTSPDHGTAHAIAGKGLARPHSLAQAVLLAHRLRNVGRS